MSTIKRISEYAHGNPNFAFVDSNFVRGGIRYLESQSELTSLVNKSDQLKEYVTLVWINSNEKFYQLVDASNIGNLSAGWSELSTTSEGDPVQISAEIIGGVLYINNEEIGQVVGGDGEDGVGIDSVVDGVLQYTINLSDGSSYNVNKVPGLSAYQVWLFEQSDPELTVEDFLASLIGPQGPPGDDGGDGLDGEDGRTVLNGATDPNDLIGVDGDFYINTSTAVLFGPKTTTWPSGIPLVGPQGPSGVSPEIAVNPAVTTLDAGLDASVATIVDGNTTTLTFSVPRGADGQNGEDGVGVNSVSIDQDGNLLISYTDNPSSPTSLGNVIGPQGPDGLDGKTILSGNGAPSIQIGVPGDFYIDLDTYDFYGPMQVNEWGEPTSLIGPQGPPGETIDPVDPNLSAPLEIEVESGYYSFKNRVNALSFTTDNTVEDVIRAMFSPYIANTIDIFSIIAHYEQEDGSYAFGASLSFHYGGTGLVEYGRGVKAISATLSLSKSQETNPTYNESVKIENDTYLNSTDLDVIPSSNSQSFPFDPVFEDTLGIIQQIDFEARIYDSTDSSTNSKSGTIERFVTPYVFGSQQNILSSNYETSTVQAILDDIHNGAVSNYMNDFQVVSPSSMSYEASGNITQNGYFTYIVYPTQWGDITNIVRNAAISLSLNVDYFLIAQNTPLENKWDTSINYNVYRYALTGSSNDGDTFEITF